MPACGPRALPPATNAWRHRPRGPRRNQPTPSFSAASLVPSTRFLIFWKATSRAKSGEPWLGFSSMLNGEKPQSSVAPSCSLAMKFDACCSALLTSSGTLDPGVERVDHADVGHLGHAVGVVADALADDVVDAVLVPLAGELDEEVTRVHAEHARQQVVVVDVRAVHGVTVAAGAGVHADPGALLRREACEHAVVEIDEVRQRFRPVHGLRGSFLVASLLR